VDRCNSTTIGVKVKFHHYLTLVASCHLLTEILIITYFTTNVKTLGANHVLTQFNIEPFTQITTIV